MTEHVPQFVMNLLLELDKARADGDPWCNLGPRAAWGEGTVDFALKHQFIEANTVDGEETEYRITPTGQKALCGEMPDAVVTDEPLGLPVNEQVDGQTAELLRLLANDNGWMLSRNLPKSISYYKRQLAQDNGFIEARGKAMNREYRVTEKGLRMLGWDDAAISFLKSTSKPSTVSKAEQQKHIDEVKARVLAKKAAAAAPQPPVEISGPETNTPIHVQVEGDTTPEDVTHAIVQQMNDFADRVHPAPLPPMPTTYIDYSLPPEDHTCTDDCQNCVYRDVVELLEARVPGVRDVVNGLKLINRRS